MVGQDYVVQYKSQALQLDRATRGRVPAKSSVLVRETEDGRLRVVHVARDGRERVCAWTVAVARTATRVAAPDPVPLASPERIFPRPPNRPAADHPWRAQHKRWEAEAIDRRASVTPRP